jgi:hypothetical protein
MIIVIYPIPYNFCDYNHGWKITILKDYVDTIIKILSIK